MKKNKNQTLLFILIIFTSIYLIVSIVIKRETLKVSNGGNSNNTWLEYLSRVEQQTDEILEITIEKNFTGCISIGQPARINFKTKNTSEQSIFLNSNFRLSPSKLSISGNLLPIFFTNDL